MRCSARQTVLSLRIWGHKKVKVLKQLLHTEGVDKRARPERVERVERIERAKRVLDTGFNYLMLSDVHLGSDIVPHLRPWATTSWLMQEAEVDAQLISLIEHYRTECDPERPWRLVIAGDFLDLVGVSIKPDMESTATPLTAEEHLHGLGSAADHVVHKMRAIAARHPGVFRSLMRFLAAGHSLVIVRGNHDVELHWRAAQRALIDAIVNHAAAECRTELASRIEICPWFFAVDGLLYVEHGHEFDAMCSYGDPLMPTCARDSRRIRSTPFSVLLRNVARPTRGLSTASYGYVGMSAYITLLMNLGFGGSARIAVRYARASHRLVSETFAQAVDRGLGRMNTTRVRLKRFASRAGVSEEHLAKLRGLYVQPAAKSLMYVLRSLYLDRVFCMLLALAWVAGASLIARFGGMLAGGLFAIPAALLSIYACVGSGTNTVPSARMQHGAAHIAPLFHARWVVMGHTHAPVFTEVAQGASYVNLGSWGQDDPPDERTEGHKSSCTFLVIQHHEGDYRAELLRWDEVRRTVNRTVQNAA